MRRLGPGCRGLAHESPATLIHCRFTLKFDAAGIVAARMVQDLLLCTRRWTVRYRGVGTSQCALGNFARGSLCRRSNSEAVVSGTCVRARMVAINNRREQGFFGAVGTGETLCE